MIAKTVYKDRSEWLKYRKAGFVVGSSDVGTILGLNKYLTPLKMWEQYRDGASNEENQNTSRGVYMEDGISKWFESETGNKIVKRSSEIRVYHNDKYPEWMECAPDREVFKGDRKCRALLEVKDTRLVVDMEDLNSIPDIWYAQIQFQMGISGYKQTYICICDGNKSLQYRLFDFDEDYFEYIVNYVITWVDTHITKGIAPAAETANDVCSIYPHSTDKVLRVNMDVYDKWCELCVKRAELGRIEKEVEILKNDIVVIFDDSDTMEYEGHKLATYKSSVRTSVDTKRLMAEFTDVYNELKTTKEIRTLLIK
ncbi:MAG: YqaJ viral recombinase family protein [Oscillospiraceae bacterium]